MQFYIIYKLETIICWFCVNLYFNSEAPFVEIEIHLEALFKYNPTTFL